jgi:hypothetical protein
MKITISPEEIRDILLERLEQEGYNVDPSTLHELTSTIGSYEDTSFVFDGYSVELM